MFCDKYNTDIDIVICQAVCVTLTYGSIREMCAKPNQERMKTEKRWVTTTPHIFTPRQSSESSQSVKKSTVSSKFTDINIPNIKQTGF